MLSINLKSLSVRSPQDTPRLGLVGSELEGPFTGLSIESHPRLQLIMKAEKGKGWWGKVQGTRHKLPCPAESHRARSTPPVASHALSCKAYISGKPIRDLVSRISSWRPVMQALSAWNVANFQAPGRKASVQYKPYCLHKQIRHAEPQPCSALRESLMLTYRTVYSPACTCGPRVLSNRPF